MKTVLFANNKGGVGKSALSCLLAVHLRAAGRRVLVSDWDSQANLSSTLSKSNGFECKDFAEWIRRRNAELPAAPSVVLTGSDALVEFGKKDFQKITKRLAAVENRFDHLILDVPPGPTARMFNAIFLSDSIFIPLIPTQYSLDSATQFLSWLTEMQVASKFAGFILNQVRPRDTVAAEIREALGAGQIIAEFKLRRHIESSIADHAGEIHWGSNRVAVAEIEDALAKISDRL